MASPCRPQLIASWLCEDKIRARRIRGPQLTLTKSRMSPRSKPLMDESRRSFQIISSFPRRKCSATKEHPSRSSPAMCTRSRPCYTRLGAYSPLVSWIERDLGPAASPASVPQNMDLMDDADVIISPNTGILITTLAKVHQRPPPRSSRKTAPTFSKLERQIMHLAPKYRKLLVLATQSAAASELAPVPLSSSDCSSIAKLAGLCRSPSPAWAPRSTSYWCLAEENSLAHGYQA